MLTKTFAKVIAGILAMLALPASAVAAEEATQTPTASLLPNASFETNTIEGVEGWYRGRGMEKRMPNGVLGRRVGLGSIVLQSVP